MIRTLGILLFSIPLLIACGGGSSGGGSTSGSGKTQAPLSEAFLGTWTAVDAPGNLYISIGESAIVGYVGVDCFDAQASAYLQTTERSITTSDEQGEVESVFSLDADGILTVQEEDLSIAFYRADLPVMYGCVSGEVSVQLTLAELPQQVKINRDEQDTGRVEFDIGVTFDLDGSGGESVGDLNLSVFHFARAEAERLVSLTELGASIWSFKYETSESGEVQRFTSSFSSQRGELSADGNTLVMTFDRATHPLLAMIDDTTPVRATTYINYPQPMVEQIWAGANDGPWNWSDAQHSDAFPDGPATYQTVDWVNTQTDAEGDQQGQSAWVDIKSLHIVLE